MSVVKINAITDFQAWMRSADFSAGHAQHSERGPVGSASEVWSFDVLERI